ncbi:MAG: PilW family protein [Casimicrobiaceae bacterium]
MASPRQSAFSRQRGMGIVETMVGILIGMVVLIAVYNVFAVAEGYKRTAVGAADAQTTGLFTQFVLNREISNAGNGIAAAGAQLGTCTLVDPNWPSPAGFFGGNKAIRPIPVVIRDSGNANVSDSMIITYSTAPHVISPELLVDTPMAVGTDPFFVQSPNGYRVNDLIVLNDMSGNCELSRVTAITPGSSAGDVTTGYIKVAHPGTVKAYKTSGTQDGPNVFNLGQPGEATRTLYDIVNGQLRTTDLFTVGATANPISQNIVLMKVQYGVDCGVPPFPPFIPSGVIIWTAATNSGVCGRNYAPDDLTNTVMFPAGGLATIRAIRIAIVVRSDEPEFLVGGQDNTALKGQTATLFDCSTGVCPGSININNNTLTDYYRFRIYETVVPMRNAIFNDGT